MKVYEYQQLLGFMYREDYKEDPIIAKILNILRLAMKKSMTIDFFIAIFYSYREK